MRVVVSGGGTAGHISPTLATSDALKQLDSNIELLYVGQAGGMEARIVASTGMGFAAVKAGKFRRNHFSGTLAKILNVRTLGPNARDAVRTMAGVAGGLKILRSFKPDVVFLKGGYVSLPIGIAANLLHIPFVIHESDVTPGLANRILSRWAAKIAVGFPVRSYRDFDPSRLVFTGNPVRKELLGAHRLEGIAKFNLDETLPVLFVTGGSAGAAQINDVILEALPELLQICQIIHVTGEGQYESVKFEVRRMGKLPNLGRYHPYGFLMAELAPAMAAADIVIARAGANTIADLAALSKPTVLIPNYEMAGHQVENARVLSRQGAVRVLDGSKLTADRLVGEVAKLLGDPEELARLAAGISQFARPDAAADLARVIIEVGNEQMASRGDRRQAPHEESD